MIINNNNNNNDSNNNKEKKVLNILIIASHEKYYSMHLFTNRYNHQTIIDRIYCLLIKVCHVLR